MTRSGMHPLHSYEQDLGAGIGHCKVCGSDNEQDGNHLTGVKKREQSAWQVVHDEPGERVRRFAVPGGWLYQVELANDHVTRAAGVENDAHISGWHTPVLVRYGGGR